MGYLRKECESCPSWSGREAACLRIAYGMSCVVGELPSRGGPFAAGAADNAIYKKIAVKHSARDTQVAGDHYKKMGVEPWDVVDTWPLDQRIGAYRHGALKYLMRMGSKDQNAQEIAKGKHYMEKLLEVLNDA